MQRPFKFYFVKMFCPRAGSMQDVCVTSERVATGEVHVECTFCGHRQWIKKSQVPKREIRFENLGSEDFRRLSNVHDPLIIVDEEVYFEFSRHVGAGQVCVEICVSQPHRATVGQTFLFDSELQAKSWVESTFQFGLKEA